MYKVDVKQKKTRYVKLLCRKLFLVSVENKKKKAVLVLSTMKLFLYCQRSSFSCFVNDVVLLCSRCCRVLCLFYVLLVVVCSVDRLFFLVF